MLDLKFVRENQEAVAQAMKNRHASWDASRFSELDEARRAAITEEEALQAERNATSKSIGQMMAAGEKDKAEAAKERVREINDQLAAVSAKREAADSELHDILLRTPNMPADTTPVGDDENDNPEVRRWGTPRDFEAEGIQMKPHWDLGADLHMLEPERAVKLAASRFVLLRGLFFLFLIDQRDPGFQMRITRMCRVDLLLQQLNLAFHLLFFQLICRDTIPLFLQLSRKCLDLLRQCLILGLCLFVLSLRLLQLRLCDLLLFPGCFQLFCDLFVFGQKQINII